MNRRGFLKRAAIVIGGALSLETWPKGGAESGPQLNRFDYAALKGDARALAAKPYKAPDGDLPETLAHLSWDGVQAIRFRSTRSLWYSTPSRFRVQFFHRLRFSKIACAWLKLSTELPRKSSMILRCSILRKQSCKRDY
jgi:glucans biosynthesis protein